jgi:hypothetical protein
LVEEVSPLSTTDYVTEMAPGYTVDSRSISPGQLFVDYKGELSVAIKVDSRGMVYHYRKAKDTD